MLNKFSCVVLLVVISFSLQSHCKAPLAELDKPVKNRAHINREEIVTYAKKFLGTRYRNAGIDPATGFDCSGFVYFVFKKFNIDLPRGSREYQFFGTALRSEEFKVGDILVFYGYRDSTQIGHVGIICEADGMRSKFIHASSGKAYGVTISELDSKMYTRRFYKCIDVIRN